MADNVELDAGSGGDTIAADDVGGVKYQVVKLAVGADGAASLVANANPIPVSDAGGSLTVDNGGTFAVQVTSVAAGNNNIGDVDIASIAAGNNNIGDVDVASVVPGTGATNLGKAEDAQHTSGDVGVMALFVRQDSQSDFGADGDYVPGSVDDSGGLRVSIVAGAGSGGTAAADDADFTAGTTQGTPAMGVYESSPTTVTDGDLGTVGITSTRAMKVAIDSGGVTGRAEDAAHSSGHEGIVVLAVRRDSAAVGSDTDGDYSTVNVNASGRVYVTATIDAALPAGTNGIGKLTANSGVDIGDVDVTSSALPTGAATSANQSTEITALQLIDDPVFADDAGFTIGTSKVMMAGFTADESSTDSLDEGDAGAGRITLDRKQIVTPYVHAAAGGHTPYQNLDVDESEDDVKTSPGKLFWVHAINLTNAKRYLKFYNDTAANVSVGSTTPLLTFPLPTMGDTNGAGFTIHFGDAGCQFSVAICIACTTGFAVADTGAPGTNDVIVNLGYI